MKFTYCPHCGTKAVLREIGDEGMIPYCEQCKVPLWDMFTTCIICAVVNEDKEIALLRQNYVSTTNYVCVAGVMKLGESAEETAAREIEEEIGQKVEELTFVKTYPYEKKEMLMLGFKAKVKKADFKLSGEVDSTCWFKFAVALEQMLDGSIAWRRVKSVI
jgi:NAD+ diphosphatase